MLPHVFGLIVLDMHLTQGSPPSCPSTTAVNRQHSSTWVPVPWPQLRQEPASTLTCPDSGLCIRVRCQERVKGLGLICPLITVKRSNERLPKAWVFLCRLSSNLHSPFIHSHLPLWGGLSFQTQPSAAGGGRALTNGSAARGLGERKGAVLGGRGQLPTVMDSCGVK